MQIHCLQRLLGRLMRGKTGPIEVLELETLDPMLQIMLRLSEPVASAVGHDRILPPSNRNVRAPLLPARSRNLRMASRSEDAMSSA